jgi:5-formyltetrahydrofolate cyclo-ligase
MNKQTIRHRIIQQRRQLSKEQQQQRSQQTANHLQQNTCFIQAKHIAYYLPIAGEADPTSLQKHTKSIAPPHSHHSEKTFYLPIVAQHGENSLLFAKVHKNTHYKKNKYGIKEPIYHARDLLAADQLDLVIMPVGGFDHQVNRLGMGGGYYDRTFAFKYQNNTNAQKIPILIGYAYDFQRLNKLQAENWDIPLNGIATESGILLLRNSDGIKVFNT